MDERRIDRREFLRRAGATGLAVAGVTAGALYLHGRRPGGLDGAVRRLKRYDVVLGPSEARMAIARGKSPEGLARAAVGAMGGVERFVRKGDVVLIKPNVAFDRAPSLGATTNPETLAAVVRLCLEAGARKALVTDNPINQPEGCFRKSGVERAAAEAGATLVYPRAGAFEEVFVGGEAIGTWPMLYAPLKEATKVIGVAPCKDHNLCGASMTMKNWYGLLGGRRNQFHQDIHGVIADFAHLIRPTLVFLDATRVLMRNGPTGGSLGDVAPADTVVCGVDMVAVDAFGYTLLGRDDEGPDYLRRAHARGLGNRDWKALHYREVQV